MAEKKITKREVINTMLADENVKGNEMYVAYLQNELKLLDKKAEKKANAQETEENVAYMNAIVETLGNGKAMTVSEVQKANVALAELSNQKVASLMKKLIENGSVVKATEKGKSVFSLA